MEEMSLSQVCKKYGFTRRVIQGYEKEGLVKHTSKNKYGYLMYDTNQVKNIAYIRYLQMNGLTLKEISQLAKSNSGVILSASILKDRNKKLKEKEKEIEKIISANERITKIFLDTHQDNKKKSIDEIVMTVLKEM